MKYVIQTIELGQTPNGAQKATVNIVDKDGQEFEKVTLWGKSWPNLSTLKANDEVEGEYTEQQNGQWLNKTLYPPKAPTTGFKGGGSTKMMEIKAKNIEEAQKRKSESIAFFNATNSAIALVKEFGIGDMSEPELKVKIRAWRDHFLSEYEAWDKIPF